MTAATLLALGGDASAQYQYLGTVSQARPNMTFPEYTADEKRTVAEQARIFLEDLYVNRPHKIAFYGDHVDPVPQINNIVANAENMASAELHAAIQDVFKAQRDHHTNYGFPAPMGCMASVAPLTFGEYFGEDRPVAVRDVWYGWQGVEPNLAHIMPGDQLVSYNGLPAREAIDSLIAMGYGANDFGGYAFAVSKLTLRMHNEDLPPVEDTLDLVLARPDGSTYEVSLSWQVLGEYQCLAAMDNGRAAAAGLGGFSGSQEAFHQQALALSRIHDPIASQAAAAGVQLFQSRDPILSWGIIEENNERFGYIRLASFVPAELDVYSLVFEAERILREELADTDGLVFDIRSNGGGYVVLVDWLAGLFTDELHTPSQFRLINTDANRELVNSSGYLAGTDDEHILDDVAGTDRTYSLLGTYLPLADSKITTRAYFQPVAVLTDAMCYSACDMFAARMQDFGLATIWGEDLKTGAGGANVWDHEFFLYVDSRPDSPFVPLPGGQTMRVAHGQIVRGGNNWGFVVEDNGVVADRRARPTRADLINGGYDQLRRITRDLAWESWAEDDDW